MSAPRIIRGPAPKKKIRPHNYRKVALPALRRDFQDRCAYSMQHVDRAGGWRAMDVDHHDPHLPSNRRHSYENLFLATRHCNGAKGQRPTPTDKTNRLRFLNPCKEEDYGLQIFEDLHSGEVWGATREARYHILYCDLNAPHLVKERKTRRVIKTILSRPARVDFPVEFMQTMNVLRAEMALMIPTITLRTKSSG